MNFFPMQNICPVMSDYSACIFGGSGGRIGQTYSSALRKSLSKRGDQASPAQLGITARLNGSL